MTINTRANATLFDNSLTNGHGNAIIFVTHNWEMSGPYNNGVLSVFDTVIGLTLVWTVYNEDSTSISIGASFNMLAFAS